MIYEPPTRLIPLAEWPKYHPWPGVATLRKWVEQRGRNGFEGVVRRIGGRLIVDEARFFEWVDRQDD